MQEYTLIDHIFWSITRRIPLSISAVTSILGMVNNTYTTYIQIFAAMSNENSLDYLQSMTNICNDQGFFDNAQSFLIPNNFFTFIDVQYLGNGVNFTANQITQLLNIVELTPEFSDYLTALDGITPINCQMYSGVINALYYCPKFVRDAETFP